MSTMSTNLNLELQAIGERASLTVLNANLGKIDDFAGEVLKVIDPPAYSNDCNDIDENCTVYVTDTATHSPGAWYLMQTVYYASNAIIQYAFGVTSGDMKVRVKSTSWSNWRIVTFADNRGYVDVTVPNGTVAGIYLVGTYATTGIPENATIISAQCMNSHASLCIVTGFATWSTNVYVYVAEPVQVGDGVVRITYLT